MSTFRWAYQKNFSEGLQNLGFISVARQYYRETKILNNLYDITRMKLYFYIPGMGIIVSDAVNANELVLELYSFHTPDKFRTSIS